jgi:hypothetical protein
MLLDEACGRVGFIGEGNLMADPTGWLEIAEHLKTTLDSAMVGSSWVGGLYALVGVLVGAWLANALRRRTDRQTRRAEKFEELVAAVYQFDHWLDTMRSFSLSGGNNPPNSVSPLPTIVALSTVYFPQFEKRIAELQKAALAHELWVKDAAHKKMQGDANYDLGLKAAYEPYLIKRDELLRDLRKQAKRKFR